MLCAYLLILLLSDFQAMCNLAEFGSKAFQRGCSWLTQGSATEMLERWVTCAVLYLANGVATRKSNAQLQN